MRSGPGRPPVRMHADEVTVDDDLVRALVDLQFPDWAHLPLQRIASTGTDNVIYRLGSDLGLRLPRIGWAVGQVGKEHRWLPRLAPHLPLSVPEPVGLGEPGCGYPYPWLVYRWLPGVDALAGPAPDWCAFARKAAAAVLALHEIDTTGAPPAGLRGGPLEVVDAVTRRAIGALDEAIDARRALAVWDAALGADQWSEPPLWVHGDLLPGNLLVENGSLTGVIDWSATGVGDPACETMLAWAMPRPARVEYRETLAVDDSTWARGRGWTLQQAVTFIPYYARTIPDGVAAARRRLDAVLEDDR
jgi:aminoglycoside phosphotransferase (APT) family kinase protein